MPGLLVSWSAGPRSGSRLDARFPVDEQPYDPSTGLALGRFAHVQNEGKFYFELGILGLAFGVFAARDFRVVGSAAARQPARACTHPRTHERAQRGTHASAQTAAQRCTQLRTQQGRKFHTV